MEYGKIKLLGDKINDNISKVIIGKDNVIKLITVALFCSGHVLLDDIPGVGKTMLAKCLSRSIACDFKRIQFTPDLLPSDLTGINFFNQKIGDFIFRPGPLFTNIVLADEINRATPRTQASLLECMEERQVTVDGQTMHLKAPFFVIATQNPVETQGTFPLPEAQLDRFFMRLQIGYPSLKEGRCILDRFQEDNPLHSITNIASSEDIIDAQKTCSGIKVGAAVKDYIAEIIEATRKHEKISLGVSPRGCIALMKGAQALAGISDRAFVTPDDIKALAIPVLAHRIILKGHAMAGGMLKAENMISDILDKIPVPTEEV